MSNLTPPRCKFLLSHPSDRSNFTGGGLGTTPLLYPPIQGGSKRNLLFKSLLRTENTSTDVLLLGPKNPFPPPLTFFLRDKAQYQSGHTSSTSGQAPLITAHLGQVCSVLPEPWAGAQPKNFAR